MSKKETGIKYIEIKPEAKDTTDLLFKLKLEGGHTNNHRVDADLYGSVLTSMNNLIQISNEIINGNNSKICLYVEKTKDGSWETIFALTQEVLESLAQNTVNILTQSFKIFKQYKDYVEIIEFLELIVKVLLSVGKIAKIIPPKNKNGNYRIIGEKGEQELNPTAGKLISSRKWQKNLQETYYSSFNKSNIDKIGIEFKSKKLEVKKEDMESFNFENIEETPEESEFKGIFLEIVSLTFSPKSQWRFYAKSHIDYVGKAIIEAKLEDLTFFQKVKSHDYIFEDGDILRCDLKMLKYEEPQKNKFFVTHVHSKVNKENYDEQTLL